MCAVVPAISENGDLSSIIDYQKPLFLNNSQVNSLVELCRALFTALDDKCIFLAPQLCNNGRDNEFLNITQTNNVLAVTENVVVGGKIQNVKKIMVYN